MQNWALRLPTIQFLSLNNKLSTRFNLLIHNHICMGTRYCDVDKFVKPIYASASKIGVTKYLPGDLYIVNENYGE